MEVGVAVGSGAGMTVGVGVGGGVADVGAAPPTACAAAGVAKAGISSVPSQAKATMPNISDSRTGIPTDRRKILAFPLLA